MPARAVINRWILRWQQLALGVLCLSVGLAAAAPWQLPQARCRIGLMFWLNASSSGESLRSFSSMRASASTSLGWLPSSTA